MDLLQVSAGTASVLGLKPIKQDYLPTTAYFLVGERCSFSCAFCSHSRNAQGSLLYLSRLSWPAFETEEIITSLKKQANLKRVCMQVINAPEFHTKALQLTEMLKIETSLPVSLSINPDPMLAYEAKQAGVDMLCFPLDCATPELYKQYRQGSFAFTLKALLRAGELFPDRVMTHLIAGLGENRKQLLGLMQNLYRNGIKVALFAFTPLRGTPLGQNQPPELAYYREIQYAHHLLQQGRELSWKGDQPKFSGTPLQFEEALSAFYTSGCPDCNRPYYNERPGQTIYNYPACPPEAEINELKMVVERLNHELL